MKLIVGEKEFLYDNNIEFIDEIIETIDEEVEYLNEIIDCLVIDGEKVYTNYGEYLFNHIESIQEIKVETLTVIELIEETLATTFNYIENSLEPIKKLSIELKETPSQTNMNDVSDLLEGIEWMIESFAYIDKDPNINEEIENQDEWNLYAREVYILIDDFPNLLVAVAKQDYSLISNILMEKIIPIFNSMKNKIKELI